MQNKNILKWILLGIALSLVAHGYLTSHHYDIELGTLSGKAFCNINDKFNCDVVAASSYARFFGLIPMALLGALTQLILGIFVIVDYFGLSERPQPIRRFTWLLSFFIFGVSIVMGSLSYLKLGTFCIVCLATYILSLLVFVLVTKAYPLKEFSASLIEDLASAMKNQKWLYVLLILTPVFGYVLNDMKMSSMNLENMDERIHAWIQEWKVNPIKNFDLRVGLIENDQENPKMTLVEFADFGCPHCKHAEPIIDAFIKSHKDVKFVFKVFALDGTCNPKLGASGGGDGLRCEMAYAVYCANKLAQKGMELKHLIFSKQMDILRSGKLETFHEEICNEMNLNCENFKSCLKSSDAFDAIKLQSTEGADAGISGTPSFYINGKYLPNAQLLKVLLEAYNQL